jgi:hypothetical protein
LSVAIFVTVSLACGRIYRLPFDDEVFTLRFVGAPHHHLVRYLLISDDPTPPLSYLVYYWAMLAGFGQIGRRWISVGYISTTIAIWHWLTLRFIDAPMPIRILIAILFGMVPLALGQGDALRWYPMLAMTVAIGYALYLTSAERWYLTGIAFGIVGDVSFLGILPLASVLFHRYVVERKFRVREDVALLFLRASQTYRPGALRIRRRRFPQVAADRQPSVSESPRRGNLSMTPNQVIMLIVWRCVPSHPCMAARPSVS